MEALVTPPSKIVVKAMPIIHTSSSPFAVPAILLFKIFSAIRFSIPASLKMPMMPNTEMTNAQVGKMLLIPSIKKPMAALLVASLENTCAGVNSPAIRPTMVPVDVYKRQEYGIQAESDTSGTTVTIRLPAKKEAPHV